MEKLIELLNQYEDSRWESVYIEDEETRKYVESLLQDNHGSI